MKGLELSERYYKAFGEPMIREQFPEWEGRIAAGLTGSGSECYGYDDEVSADHDFEPGFCLFLPGEDVLDRRTAFQLERAYAKLPAEFEDIRARKWGLPADSATGFSGGRNTSGKKSDACRRR